MNAAAFPAPAKLNLFLHVLGRREDGYHLLQTVFQFLDYGDELRFAVRADGAVRRTDALPGVAEADDLTVRAARLLQSEAGVKQGVEIGLTKRLPMGGGLGGGSSDAATTLIALNRLWGLDLPRERLMALGARLGADVPVFLFGRSAWGEGVGERLTPIALPLAWYVVLIPPVSVSTAEIFRDPQLTRHTPPITMAAFFAGPTHNDLEPVVRRRYPPVAECLDWLGKHGAARMTGSGASVFAAFATEAQARDVYDRRPDGVKGFVARGLERHPLLEF